MTYGTKETCYCGGKDGECMAEIEIGVRPVHDRDDHRENKK
jgi:hypothetical protein